MKHILYFGGLGASFMATWQKVHFMDELVHYGFKFDIFNTNKYDSWDEANEALVKYVEEIRPVMFFTLVRSARNLYVSSVEAIKNMGVPTLFFVADSLATPYEDRELVQHFDLVWITEPETKYLYDRWGVKTILAPYAANPFAFKPVVCEYKPSVCFIGRVHGSRANMINKLTEDKNVEIDIYDKNNTDIHKLFPGKTLKVFSPSCYEAFLNYSKYAVGRRMLWSSFLNRFVNQQNQVVDVPNVHHLDSLPYEDIPKVYSKYRLALSSTSYHNTDVLKKPVSVVNLRAFEIPMSGGLQICKYNSYLAEQFEDGKEILFYRTDEEFLSKVDYYLHKAHESEIAELKTAARKRAETDHTWIKRFSIAFDIFGIKRQL